jgi:hypothetical protein
VILAGRVPEQDPSSSNPITGVDMHITVGMTVELTDGKGGHVAAVVLEPISLKVSHLVVDNGSVASGSRLVPAERIVSSTGRMQLSLRQEELELCDPVEQTGVLPQAASDWEVGIVRRAWPAYDSVSPFGAGPGASGSCEGPTAIGGTTWIYDRIPAGHVELRRKSSVVGRDYRFVAHLDGLVVDPDLKVTQLVLEKGHLWRHRRPTVPIGEIRRIKTDLVQLSLTRAQLDANRSAVPRIEAESGDAA